MTIMTLGLRGRVDAAQSISSWDGRNATFEDAVGTAVEAAARAAAESGNTAPLYRAWAALVKVERRGRVRETGEPSGSVRGIGRGRMLDLWDRVCSVPLGNTPKWRAARNVLSGTVTDIWEDLAGAVHYTAQEVDWLDAVHAALKEATSLESAALADLMALADLVALVHEVERDPEGAVSCSDMGLWRGVVVREAEKAARLANCEDVAVLCFPDAPRFRPDGADPESARDVARLTVCLYADSRNRAPGGGSPIDALAAGVAAGVGGSWRDKRTLYPSKPHDEPTRREKIGLLLRHLVFESRLLEELLGHRIGYRRWQAGEAVPAIGVVSLLEQTIFLLGPPSVGKTSFIMASQEFCSKPGSEREPGGDHYPVIRLDDEPHEGDEPHECDEPRQAGRIEQIRDRWRRHDLSKTDTVMVAQVGAFGLCSFRIADLPGEPMMGEGVWREARKGLDKELPKRIKWLKPSLLAVMLSEEIPKDSPRNQNISHGLERALEALRSVGHLDGERAKHSFPVYIVMNKSDLVLKKFLQGREASPRVVALKDELHERAFGLFEYFAASGRDGGVTVDEALANVLDDRDLTPNIATRRLVCSTLERWRDVLEELTGNGFLNITLVFASSRSGATEPNVEPGVKAFWRHLWERSAPLFSAALSGFARRTFVDDLEDVSRKVIALLDRGTGLRLPPIQIVTPEDVVEPLEGLRDKADVVAGKILGNYGPDTPGKFRNWFGELDPLCDGIVSIAVRAETGVTRCSQEWDRRLRKAILELNVSPDKECSTFGSNTEDDDEERELQDARREPGLALYYGALTESATCRNEARTWWSTDTAGAWLRGGRQMSILKRVRSRIEAACRDDVDRLSSFFAKERLDAEARSWTQVVPDALNAIADYGFRDGDRRPDSGSPDYRYLTVMLFDNDRFRVEGLNKVNCRKRIGLAIELIRRLARVRCYLTAGGPEAEGSRLGSIVRGALLGFACGHVMQQMGFDVENMKKEGAREAIDDSFEQVMKLDDEVRKRSVKDRVANVFGRGESFARGLGTAEKSAAPYFRSGRGPKAGPEDVRRALVRLWFAKEVIADDEAWSHLTMNVQSTKDAIHDAVQRFADACEYYEESVEKYVREALRVLWSAHWHHLDRAGLFAAAERFGEELERRIAGRQTLDEKEKLQGRLEDQLPEQLEGVVQEFSAVVDQLSGGLR